VNSAAAAAACLDETCRRWRKSASSPVPRGQWKTKEWARSSDSVLRRLTHEGVDNFPPFFIHGHLHAVPIPKFSDRKSSSIDRSHFRSQCPRSCLQSRSHPTAMNWQSNTVSKNRVFGLQLSWLFATTLCLNKNGFAYNLAKLILIHFGKRRKKTFGY